MKNVLLIQYVKSTGLYIFEEYQASEVRPNFFFPAIFSAMEYRNKILLSARSIRACARDREKAHFNYINSWLILR